MVKLIVGEKGKGKTKHLLEKVNNDVQTVSGNIVFVDKSTKHMYELNNKVRLIDLSDYFIENTSEFFGFLVGIIAGNRDIEEISVDNFLVLSHSTAAELEASIERLEKISEKFGVEFILTASVSEAELSAKVKSNILISL